MKDHETTRKLRLPTLSAWVIVVVFIILLGLKFFNGRDDNLKGGSAVEIAGAFTGNLDDSLQFEKSARFDDRYDFAGARSDAPSTIEFDCQQKTEVRLGVDNRLQRPDTGRVTLRFNSTDQTVTLGTITGLEYERARHLVSFSYTPGIFADHQFTDAYIFDPIIGKLSQQVKIPVAQASDLAADTDGYAIIYSAKYACSRKRLRR